MSDQRSRHFQLLNVFMPMLSGIQKDEFGKESPLPKSLAFDRVNQGRAFSSRFLLSRLPIELVWHIVEYIPKVDLPNLALVNRDCRQLAHSRQFSTVVLDYSPAASDIVDALLQASRCDQDPDSKRPSLPSIGPCIRRITIATQPGWLQLRHGVSDSEDFHGLKEGQRRRLLDDACSAYLDGYVQNMIAVLGRASVLPHLETLTWIDRTALHRSAFTALFSSTIRNLTLARVQVECPIILKQTIEQCNWNLTSLYLDLMLPIPRGDKTHADLSPIINKLVYLASPTLETFEWHTSPLPWLGLIQYDPSQGPRAFGRLRDLEITNTAVLDPQWLQALIRPGEKNPLRHLSLDIGRNETVADFFEKCGTLPCLETLVWRGHTKEHLDKSIAFLKANKQLRKFGLGFETSPAIINDTLLPLFSKSFTQLTSLSLIWEGEGMPPGSLEGPERADDHLAQEALSQLATLSNLEQLQLNVAYMGGWRRTWLIDHSALQEMCCKLPRLRILVFVGDTYDEREDGDTESLNGLNDPIRYYTRRLPYNWRWRLDHDTDLPGDPGIGRYEQLYLAWEEEHCDRMLEIAKQYAAILPKLEWMLVGERPIEFRRPREHDEDQTINAISLTEERDSCYTLLERTFGRNNSACLG